MNPAAPVTSETPDFGGAAAIGPQNNPNLSTLSIRNGPPPRFDKRGYNASPDHPAL